MKTTQELKAKLIDTVDGYLEPRPVLRSEVEQAVLALATVVAPELSEQELQECIDEIESHRIVVIGGSDGVLIAKGHEPWLDERKGQIDWSRWNAYRKLLKQKKMNPLVVDHMNQRNDKLLDLAGDPNASGSWSRRGLVIGDVQSGKTANYLALFNKAADAGYKVFILLAGSTNKLRQQTQARVDEGFIGKDTKNVPTFGGSNTAIPMGKAIGIGKITNTEINSLTNFSQDFSKNVAGTLFHLNNQSTPTVFVIKKNKTVLKNLAEWLEMGAGEGKKISAPMLLLDDEADYASINTNPLDSEATAINQGIKKLSGMFEKNSYVGFTATPFANVLIDDAEEEGLFPRDFIINLESPTNYFGARSMFDAEGEPNKEFMRVLHDAENCFPIKHTSKLAVSDLPESLEDAIITFFITNAVRDLRKGQIEAPRSMLVNVSRFVKVQQQVQDLVTNKVAMLKDALRYDNKNKSLVWKRFEKVFAENFPGISETWSDVSSALVDSTDDIRVQIVNSSKNSNDLEATYASKRARVIAIGGDVLSRGLTLEGLSSSYFYRRSLAYDTLMQMARWFGYRDGYRDLCKLWIDDEVALWYKDIADALDELREDLEEMARRGLEPKNFGLAVRCHPGSMMTVTARNKARSAREDYKEINVSEIDAETTKMSANPKSITNNWVSLKSFVSELPEKCDNEKERNSGGKAIWKDVPRATIAKFLGSYKPSEANVLFAGRPDSDKGILASFIDSYNGPSIAKWDVVIMSGSGSASKEFLPNFQLVKRQVFSQKSDPDLLYFSGNHSRLGGRADLGLTLSPESKAVISAWKATHGREANSHDFRKLLSKPLLLIYPVEAKLDVSKSVSEKNQGWLPYETPEGGEPLVGIHIAFPKQDISDTDTPRVKYWVNSVWQKIEQISVIPVTDADEELEMDEEK